MLNPTHPLQALARTLCAALCVVPAVGCDATEPPEEPAAQDEADEDLVPVLELRTAEDGNLEGTIEIDGEVVSIAVETRGSVRELVLEGRQEYARWTYDLDSLLTVGHIDDHTFGRFEDRYNSLDREYWDEMRASRAAELIAVVSEAAWDVYANAELDDSTLAAVHDVTRLAGYVENLGTIPKEWEDELGTPEMPESEELTDIGEVEPPVLGELDLDLTAPTDTSAACYSQVSAAGHYVTSVQVFQTGCRINHYSFTRRPSGGCNFTRCVKHHYSNGGSASGSYCNNHSQSLTQAHVVPRNGRSYGLWSHHWAPGTPLDAWYWRTGYCPS